MPVRNEAENVAPLIAEIVARARRPLGLRNHLCQRRLDGCDRRAAGGADEAAPSSPADQARTVSSGQSAAVRSGVAAARGAIVATLDGDGQNNPAFLPELIAAVENGGGRVGLVGRPAGRTQGYRLQENAVARSPTRVRSAILRDGTRDTGCGLKAFPRELFLSMPYFDGLHRFLPALVRREGFDIAYVDVIDRPRHSGVSNYGFFDRLWIGIMDLAGVWWLIRRKKPTPVVTEV